MDEDHSFVLRAAGRGHPVAHAIARSINSYRDRVAQALALRFTDGNAAREDSRCVQWRIIGVRGYLRHLVLILRNNRIIADAAGAVRRRRYDGATNVMRVVGGICWEDLLHRQPGRAGTTHISGLRARGDDDIVWVGYDDDAKIRTLCHPIDESDRIDGMLFPVTS